MSGQQPGPAAGPDDDEELDGTIVVHRAPAGGVDDDVEGTVVVDRGAPARGGADDLEGTVVVARDGAEDRTVVIAPGVERPAAPAKRTAARRTRIRLPDDTPVSERVREAAGAGSVERYEPRAIPAAPELEPVPAGPEPTRAVAPGMPSVARASRRAGRRALLIAGIACLVSVAGLVVIGFVIFG